MATPTLNLGLFGFGCVGQGLYDVLHRTPGLQARITRICVKDRSKQRPVIDEAFTFDRDDILNDDDVNVVVELIDDADAAFDIVSTALRRGKAVVTANKKMVATRFHELLALQRETGAPLLYEASCCGSIPIIRNLEEYYDNDLLDGVQGIVNGTTNFILTRVMASGDARYGEVLAEAQRLGFAESDPTLDVEGYDASFKTLIIAAHAFGVVLEPGDVIRRGITSVTSFDAATARARGATIKLVSNNVLVDNKLTSFVLPRFVAESNTLAKVDDEYNAVLLHGAFSDAQSFIGKGAGGHPTASAVLSDIAALRYNYRYEYKKLEQGRAPQFTTDVPVRVYARSSDDTLLRTIPWSETDVDYRGRSDHYVIGTTTLSALRDSEAFRSDQAFIALL